MKHHIKRIVAESITVKKKILYDEVFMAKIEKAISVIKNAFLNQNKLLLCGNGGSAADAQHLAAEFSGRFYMDRKPLFAEALHVNSSYLTAVANDYGYEAVFARALEAKAAQGDIFIAISTSGNSPNILNAIKKAKEMQVVVIGFTGNTGGKMADLCDILLNIPSTDTPRIQESHIMVGHIICELVEKELF